MKFKYSAICLALAGSFSVNAASEQLWTPAEFKSDGIQKDINVRASREHVSSLNIESVNTLFSNKNLDFYQIDVPLPNGTNLSVKLQEDSVFAPELAAKFPNIKSFVAFDLHGNRIGRFSFSPRGLHGMFRHNGQVVFLDPKFKGNNQIYVSYYKKDALKSDEFKFRENIERIRAAEAHYFESVKGSSNTAQRSTADTLRTYRLAISANGEYSQFHGGTKESVLSALNVLLNRVNEIYLVELAVRFELVANNDELIFLDPEIDQFVNDDNADLDTNQTVVDSIIGTANYDIGHIVNTAGGGVAGFGVVCNDEQKAKGLTGSPEPTGDAFHVDFVAHEIGHQFGGSHSFNGKDGNCGTRTASTAFEPGSGSTIMGYAGICASQNLQANTDPTFHIGSIDQINAFIAGNGASCATTSSISNTQPTVDAGSNYVIPANTPFKLTGSGSDPDDDTITYMWEQRDPNGVETNNPEEMVDNGSNPLFRSWTQVSDNERYFPRFSDVLANTTVLGETYPTTSRTMNFQLTVRDAKGGVNSDAMQLQTVATGSGFKIIKPSGSSSWSADRHGLLLWDTSNSESDPINCSHVDLSVSADSGVTFEMFETGIANDGIHVVTAPATSGENYRLKLECSNNVFFTVSSADVSVEDGTSITDTDGDGMSDEFETANNLDPSDSSDASGDSDDDGLSNLMEYLAGTTPSTNDSDNDGIPDNVELALGLNPTDAEDGSADLDGDGVNNLTEYTMGTDLRDADSAPNIALRTYDFEAEDSVTDWTLSAENAWARSDSSNNGGSFSLASATISDSQESVAQFTASNFADSELNFDVRVSSESSFDNLEFEVDGKVVAKWSGDVAWQTITYKLGSGEHTIIWRYRKDEVGSSGEDKAWIDNVKLRVITGDAPVTEPPGPVEPEPEPEDPLVAFDYDNDNKADVAVRRPSNFFQYINYTNAEDIGRIEFGKNANDIPVSGDFDGDGIWDVAVRRPSNQFWYIKNSSGNDPITGNDDGLTRRAFGLQETDIPVPADYDGDGKTDIAVRRPSTQFWYILNSSGVDNLTNFDDGITRLRFGTQEGDIPVPADYDGDGKADLAVRRPGTQYWYIRNSSGVDAVTGHDDGITRLIFGRQETDIPVPADYDGDGKADIAVRRPSNYFWYIRNSSTMDSRTNFDDGISRVQFGKNAADIPVVADYDGDGKADIAVRRPGNQTFYIQNSGGGNFNSSLEDGIQRLNFGKQEADIPLAAPVATRMDMAEDN